MTDRNGLYSSKPMIGRPDIADQGGASPVVKRSEMERNGQPILLYFLNIILRITNQNGFWGNLCFLKYIE